MMSRFPFVLLSLAACIPVAVEGQPQDTADTADTADSVDSDSVDSDTVDSDSVDSDTADSDSVDSDTADDPHDGEMLTLAADCSFQDAADLGWLIRCESQWSETDAAQIDGGSVYLNLLDIDLASVYTDVLDIDGVDALLEATTLRFSIAGVDQTSEYTVYYWVETRDGSASSDEVGYVVEPL